MKATPLKTLLLKKGLIATILFLVISFSAATFFEYSSMVTAKQTKLASAISTYANASLKDLTGSDMWLVEKTLSIALRTGIFDHIQIYKTNEAQPIFLLPYMPPDMRTPLNNKSIYVAAQYRLTNPNTTEYAWTFNAFKSKKHIQNQIYKTIPSRVLLLLSILLVIILATRWVMNDLLQDLAFLSRFIKNLPLPNNLTISIKTQEIYETTQLLEETKRKLDEEALKREALSKQQIKYDLAQQVAHDIRSPLGALSVLRTAIPESKPLERELLQQSISKIKSIADGILSSSKVSLQTKSSLNICHTLKKIFHEKSVEFSQKPVKLNMSLHLDEDTFVYADQLTLERILSNLINNSIEAISTDREPDINLSIVSDNANNVEIKITDNGIGIPADVISKVGQRGFSYGKVSYGNGIGVYFAIEHIKQWGRSFSIQSTENIGTCVSIKLMKV